ncbi:MAG TPA: cytochrome c peroxidase, partial [Kofleriaceae bacterium]|nr:cytochrome c peroxidase [Kofleriaceae bacterium]
QQFSPVPEPPPAPTNAYADDREIAELGQALFFELDFAGPIQVGDDGTNGGLGEVGETGKVACASCHDPQHWFTDTRSVPNKLSLGVRWTGRNAPSLVNVAYYTWWNWAGAHPTGWKQGAGGPESGANFGGNRLQFVHMLYEQYRDMYDALFPVPLDPALDPEHPEAARFPPEGRPKRSPEDPDGAWEMMAPDDRAIVNRIMANCGKALEAYERLLVSRNAPLDRYIAGDTSALSASAKRGLKLFVAKAACVACHQGPTFTDNEFHNTAVPQTGETQDLGRYDDLPKALGSIFNGTGELSDDPEAGAEKLDIEVTEDMIGQFRTKSLRHIAMTGPYMHNGAFETLEEVVRFYNDGGAASDFPGVKDPLMVPLNLSEQEVADLVAFLEALTGDPVPEELTVDTSVP